MAWTPQVRVGLVKEPGPSLNLPKQSGPVTAARAIRQVIPADATTERFVVIALDTQNVPVGACTVTTGLLNSSLIHPRDVRPLGVPLRHPVQRRFGDPWTQPPKRRPRP